MTYQNKLELLWYFTWNFCGISLGIFAVLAMSFLFIIFFSKIAHKCEITNILARKITIATRYKTFSVLFGAFNHHSRFHNAACHRSSSLFLSVRRTIHWRSSRLCRISFLSLSPVSMSVSDTDRNANGRSETNPIMMILIPKCRGQYSRYKQISLSNSNNRLTEEGG